MEIYRNLQLPAVCSQSDCECDYCITKSYRDESGFIDGGKIGAHATEQQWKIIKIHQRETYEPDQLRRHHQSTMYKRSQY